MVTAHPKKKSKSKSCLHLGALIINRAAGRAGCLHVYEFSIAPTPPGSTFILPGYQHSYCQLGFPRTHLSHSLQGEWLVPRVPVSPACLLLCALPLTLALLVVQSNFTDRTLREWLQDSCGDSRERLLTGEESRIS